MNHQTTLKALAVLLDYPSDALVAAHQEIREAIRSLAPAERADVTTLIDEIVGGDLLELQAAYVGLFDRNPRLSLNLFEHVCGDSRVRGQAMVALLTRYRRAGIEPAGAELPDYLPIYLEFVSSRPALEAEALLAEIAHVLAPVRDRLVKRGSAYAGVFDALIGLTGKNREFPRATAPEEPEEPEDIDRAWAEAPVEFGPGAAPACSDGSAMRSS
ncbi:MAG: nitrate reductase molybdenum cofactor assembly chaperone [Alphaproteobacteria bacterium]|nr:nitrate reductase molybdenum cofactor assembly chaperone [Alphaproteobacteria bacterium]